VLVGEQPNATRLPAGCVFVDRCPLYRDADDELRHRCRTVPPVPTPAAGHPGHRYACHGV